MAVSPEAISTQKEHRYLGRDIHQSARLASELQDVFKDDEGEGELIKSEEDLEKERKAAKSAARKAQKKLKERMKNKNFRGSALVAESGEDANLLKMKAEGQSDDEDESSGSDGEYKESSFLDVPLGDGEMDEVPPGGTVDSIKPGGAGEDDLAEFKKTNVGMLRVPFDTKVSWPWVTGFRNFVIGTYVIFFIKLGTTSYYVVHQPYVAFGRYPGNMSVTSLGLFLFALVCDGKEVYHVIRKVVPCRDDWVPLITVDLQEEVSSLFIGPHTIELSQISEITAFPDSFAIIVAIAYWVGCIPWCLLSVILRDQFLQFKAMRIVSPTLGAIMAVRAILGPGFLVKMAFSFYYLFALDPKTRERFGSALQQEKSVSASFWFGVSFSFIAWFTTSIILFHWLT